MFKTVKKIIAVFLIMFVMTGEFTPVAPAYAATSSKASTGYKLGKAFTVKFGKTVKFSNDLSISFYESRLWDTSEVSFDIEVKIKNKESEYKTLVYTPAEVGTGFMNHVYCGDYKIEVTNAVHKKSVKLVVTKPEKAKKSVMNGKSDEYYTTKANEYFEEERFILFVPKGITLRQDTLVMINEIMDLLENKTGWKFLSIPLDYRDGNTYLSFGYKNVDDLYKDVDPEGDKIHINVVEDFDNYGYISSAFYSSFNYVYSKEYDNGCLSVNTVAHELAHVLNFYNAPMAEDADTFTEGFAMALAYQITNDLKDKYPDTTLNYIIMSDVEENPDGSPSPITKSTAQELFEHNYRENFEERMQQRNYQIGGAVNLYILEKYGANGYVKLKKKLKKNGFTVNSLTLYDSNIKKPSIADYSKALKSAFGKNFFKNFATWFKKNKERLLKIEIPEYIMSDDSELN